MKENEERIRNATLKKLLKERQKGESEKRGASKEQEKIKTEKEEIISSNVRLTDTEDKRDEDGKTERGGERGIEEEEGKRKREIEAEEDVKRRKISIE